MFIEKEKVERVTTYSDMLFREIALRTNSISYYDRVLSFGKSNQRNMNNILKHNWIYDADMDITDRCIKNFLEEFDPDPSYKLHKTFMDIEVDLQVNDYIGFPEEDIAPCPVNIITLIDGKTLIDYTFVFDDPNNVSQQEFKKSFEADPDALKKELIDSIYERNSLLLNSVNITFYPTEAKTIEAFFKTIHEIDPDTCSSWNQVFDVKTMLNRLVKLYEKDPEVKARKIRGYDKMLETVCDSKYFQMDAHNGQSVYISPKAYYKASKGIPTADRMDEFQVLDSIFWSDQMLLYANVRRVNGAKESYALDAIASDELGSEKLDYTGYTIKNLPWKNFKKFVFYNIFDVVLLERLETLTLDLDMLQKLCEVTGTRKYKVFKKTIALKNFVSKFAELQGYVISNNKNAQYGNDSDYFRENYLNEKKVVENDPTYLAAFQKKENFGAYVGDPNLNDNCGIEDEYGHKSKFIFEHVFDEDLKKVSSQSNLC